MLSITRACIYIMLVLFVCSCKQEIKPEALYGKWKYIKIQNTLENPLDTVSADEMNAADPSISFSTNNDLVIMWEGVVLSSGKFRIEGNDIQYTENLPDGSQRSFPFFIRKIDKENFIFETKGRDGTRVTARRVN